VGNTSTSIAVDAKGYPHISYRDVSKQDLKYAVKTGDLWAIETVPDPTPTVGLYTAIAVDNQGNPHISYHDYTNADLKYAMKSGDSWTIETVDVTGNMGIETSIAVGYR
jgi:hypothetical protein